MSDLKLVSELREYDEAAGPADGWWVAYKDLQRSADLIEQLQADAIVVAQSFLTAHNRAEKYRKALENIEDGNWSGMQCEGIAREALSDE